MRYFVKDLSRPNVTLTCYIHDKSPELSNADVRPAVLIFPGGGYYICSDREAEPIALSFMAEGYQAFVLRYTVGKETTFHESYADALEAIAWIKSNACDLQLDSDKLAVVGFSAGGHLAAAIGTMSDDKPAALVLGYPHLITGNSYDAKKQIPAIIPHVDRNTPPAYIFTTATDDVVPPESSLKFALALDQAGVNYELHVFPNGPHGLSLGKDYTSDGQKQLVNPVVQKWFGECCGWLKTIWGELDTSNDNEGLGMDRHSIGIDTPVNVLMDIPACKAALLTVFPPLAAMLEQAPSAGTYSFRVMNQFSPEIVNDALLEALENALKECEVADKL